MPEPTDVAVVASLEGVPEFASAEDEKLAALEDCACRDGEAEIICHFVGSLGSCWSW